MTTACKIFRNQGDLKALFHRISPFVKTFFVLVVDGLPIYGRGDTKFVWYTRQLFSPQFIWERRPIVGNHRLRFVVVGY